MLADILTMGDYATKPLRDVSFCYLGDGRNNTANSLLVTGAMLGMDTRICAPDALQPSRPVWEIAARLAEGSGARLTVTDQVADQATALRLAAEHGWDVRQDGQAWRRVVPAPEGPAPPAEEGPAGGGPVVPPPARWARGWTRSAASSRSPGYGRDRPARRRGRPAGWHRRHHRRSGTNVRSPMNAAEIVTG